MLTDPQIITVNSVAQSMPRISSTGLSSIYQSSDQLFKLTVSHITSNQRVRSMGRIDQRAIVADPITSVNDYETLSLYTVLDRPEVGFSIAQIQQLLAGHQAWLTSTIIAKMVGNES